MRTKILPLLWLAGGCTVGEAGFVSGTDGVAVQRERDQTTISLDPDGLARALLRDPSFRDQVVSALATNETFVAAAQGPAGPAGPPGAMGPAGPDPRVDEVLTTLARLSEAVDRLDQLPVRFGTLEGELRQTLTAEVAALRAALNMETSNLGAQLDQRLMPVQAELASLRMSVQTDVASLQMADTMLRADLQSGLGNVTSSVMTLTTNFNNTALCPRLVTKEGTVRTYTPQQVMVGSERIIYCRNTVATGLVDEMVKVGDFWIDRYEASEDTSGPPGRSRGSGPGQNTTARAISRTGATPLGGMTFFQAVAMCSNAGKRLCSNGEWQAAVAGTPDPLADSSGTNGQCVTQATSTRNTGFPNNQCISKFGAEDMIGNMGELVDLWAQAGPPTGTPAAIRRRAWGAGYNDDITRHIDGGGSHPSGYTLHLPSIVERGGHWTNGTGAGAFYTNFEHVASSFWGLIGFRCCAD